MNSLIATPVITTTFVVSGANSHSCVGQVSFVQNVDACTGIEIEKISLSDQAIVYPNPAKDWFEIKINHPGHFILFDGLGREVIGCELQFKQRFDTKVLSP